MRDATGEVLIGGVMEHVEEAGVHSGDSACAIPPPTLSLETVTVLEGYTRRIAAALEVCGPVNVQYAVQSGRVFVIEANPRASRTVPFVAKATGVPLAKISARVMVGATLAELRVEGLLPPPAPAVGFAVKEAVLPFDRFPDVDALLGPEMRSTGEVMGIAATVGLAFAKSQIAAGNRLPEGEGDLLLPRRSGQGAGPPGGARLHRARLPPRRDGGHRRLPRGRWGGGDDARRQARRARGAGRALAGRARGARRP